MGKSSNVAGCLVLAVGLVPVQFAAGAPISPSEWRYYTPVLSPQIRAFRQGEADRILARFCETPIQPVRGVGPGCTTRQLGARFSDIVDDQFFPKGVVFGHFLGPGSDDAAVSGWSAESPPYRWGGTLLLSRRGSAWIPIWYRSAMTTDVCEKIALAGGREILLCEDEDSGMGNQVHDLYPVDLKHPSDPRRSLLARADSYKDVCLERRQVLRRLRWRADRQEFSVEVDTTGWSRSTEPYCEGYPTRRPATLRLSFEVGPDGLHKVEPEPPEKK